jgi:hypothetical protein
MAIKTSSMKYQVNKIIGDEHLFVTIETENNYFSVTGSLYEAKKPKVDKNLITCGCIHNDILKFYPELKMFVDLHLSDLEGRPMYPIANGFYHLKRSSKEVTKEYLRITDKEYDELNECKDELSFTFMLGSLGIVDRWKEEATTALEELERLCNT